MKIAASIRTCCISFSAPMLLLAGCAGSGMDVKRYDSHNEAPHPPEDITPFDLPLTQGKLKGEQPPDALHGIVSGDQRPGNPAAWGESALIGVGRQFDPIMFGQESSELDLNALRLLQGYALWLRQHARVWVVVAGHCDLATTPGYAYNLGQARALAVQDYLSSQGVPLWRIFCISYGSAQPANSGKSPDASALNNRVELLPFLQPEGVEAPDSVKVRDADSPDVAPPAPPPAGEVLK